ncbi:MAG: corrinoid protein [Thaumarchaeota archaeon]|nr:corrinoid protein [Nitrososphaerota archaeon]
MSGNDYLQKIKECLVNMDLEGAKENTKKALEAGANPQDIISRGIAEGMDIVGKKFEEGEYFLSELLVAGEIAKEILKILNPYIKSGEVKLKKLGKVVIGTVRGDLHDIGKNIVAMMLNAAGFEVIDLGADVPPEKFVEAARENDANIVAMSALLSVTMPEMKVVIDELKKAGLRDKVKVIVGGAPVTEEYAKEIGADGYGENAIEGVRICKSWMIQQNS